MSEHLKLRAVDADDLSVLGACLQDALVPVQDMSFLAGENRFVMVANRFRWEKLKESGDSFERVHCGISFEHVSRARTMGFTPGAAADRGRLLEVLTIIVEGNELTMVFSQDAAVRLDVDTVEVFVQDMGEPWPTLWRPHHPVEDEPKTDSASEPDSV